MAQFPPGSDLVFLATYAAIAMTKDLSANETNILANFVNALGNNLSLIAAKKQIAEAQASGNQGSTSKSTGETP